MEFVNECLENLAPPLPDLHVGGLFPKAKLSKVQGRGEDLFLFQIICLVVKSR